MTQPIASPRVDIIIDSNAAKHGAHEVNAALQSIVQNAALVNAGLNGVASQFVRTGNSAQNAAKKLKNANDNANGLGGVLGRLTGFARGAGGALGDLATSFSGLGGLAVAGGMAAIGAAIVGVGVAVTNATAQVQTYKASLTTIIGDTMKAGQAFDALADFAQRTPFTLDEAVNGFVKLSALGLTPSEKAMTSYGNTAAAMGSNLESMVEAVADATTGEYERLKGFGIKTKNEGDKLAFTFAGVTTKVGNNSKEIQDYLIGIGETKFAGGMERQAATIGGSMAALGDQIFLTFNKIGEGGFATAIAKIINSIADGLAAVTPLLSGIGNVVGSVINVIAEIGSGLGALWNSLTGGGKDSLSLLDSLTIAFQLVGQYVGIVGDLIGAAFRGVANVISWVTDTITSAFGDAWTWLTGSTTDVSGKIGLSFFGVLRAVKYVAKSIPELFSIAFEDIKKMFSGLGDIVGRLLSGDVSALSDVGTVFATSFADSAKKMGEIIDKAGEIAQDQKGAQDAVDRMLGRGEKKSIDDFAKPGPAGKPTALTKPDKSAEAAAKAEAERLKRIQEYWKTLDETVALSKMLPVEAEKHSKWLELQKLYSDKLSEQDKAALAAAKVKIADKLHEIALNKSLVAMTDDAVKLENANLINGTKRLGLTEAEASIQDALAEHRIEALNSGATLADLATEAWKTEEKRLETALKTKAAMDGQAAAVAHAKDIAASYSPQADRAQRLSTISADRVQFLQGADKAGISKAIQISVIRGMDAAIDNIKLESVREFSDSIHALADEFGGAFGKTIKSLGKAMDRLVAGAAGDLDNAGPLGSISKVLGGDVADGFQEGSKSLMKELGSTLGKTFGVSGDMAKSLGKTLGKMGGGGEIGSVVGNAANMIGIKTSGTGSQLGGAAGSLIGGPIGAAIGGLLGGVVGGLFKKAKWATGQIDLVSGNLTTGSVAGNKAAYKENAGVAGGAVGSSIQEIADALGAVISGDPNVSIGQYKGAWRVSSTGRTGKLKGKYSDVSDFGDDSEAAIAYAAQVSIQQGILSGLSDFADKILKGSNDDNFASRLSLATWWEGVLDEMAADANPTGAAIDKVTSSLDKMRSQMVAAGATSADLAILEKYRGQQLQKIVDDQTSSLRDLQKTLNGDASGKTGYALLQDSLAEYSKLQADMKAGVAVDNDDLVSAAQDVLSRAGSTYGTATSQYQSIVSMLKADTANAISSTEARVQASQDAATKAQAEWLEEQRLANVEATKQTALLTQLVAAAASGNGSGSTSMWKYVNGSAQGSMA